MKYFTDKIVSPSHVSENDKLRSYCMWHLIHHFENIVCPNSIPLIPRTLVQFWDNAKKIPEDVQKCMDSWKLLEQNNFNRLLFDDESACVFIEENFEYPYIDAFRKCRHPAMRSDFFRLCYIYKKGGFYVDTDDVYKNINIEPLFNNNMLKIQPLCYSIKADSMVNIKTVIESEHYNQNFIYYVNNNPIIAPPKHPLIQIVLERSKSRLLSSEDFHDVQSLTGPGNLTASLINYTIETTQKNGMLDFLLINNWNDISEPQWQLEYRKDKRNWRIWDGSDI